MIVWAGLKSLVSPSKRKNQVPSNIQNFQSSTIHAELPETQQALLLHAVRQPYQWTTDHSIPSTKHDREVLVRARTIGLNPIDWKAPDFGFGIPSLPYIAGRELVGDIVRGPRRKSRLKAGDTVIVISTDYRDLRKAAFQEYVIATDFNVARLPPNVTRASGSIIGVAFAASAIALGVCMGLDFSKVAGGPNLLSIVRGVESAQIPEDIRQECLEGINDIERAREGDYLVIWGGSTASAHVAAQLAKLAGLKVIMVVDKLKHGIRLSNHAVLKPDLLIDSHDSVRAIDIIRAASKNSARFGLDTIGKDTAAHILAALKQSTPPDLQLDKVNGSVPKGTSLPTPPSTPAETVPPRSHLVGLSGVPKINPPSGTAFHNVPIKLFHDVPAVGEAMVLWLERLLAQGLLVPPDVIDAVEGLENINGALDRLRRREISGGRLVVNLS